MPLFLFNTKIPAKYVFTEQKRSEQAGRSPFQK
jgi:hypothetical protein